VDQLVCAGRRRYPLALLTLGFWAVELKAGARAGLGLAGLRIECDRGLHVQRAVPGALLNLITSAGTRTNMVTFSASTYSHVFLTGAGPRLPIR